jgi:YHS domain-containing protein
MKKFASNRAPEDSMKKLSLGIAILFCSCFVILFSCSARTAPVNVDADGVALKGYDPVAYFTMGRPVKGLTEFQQEWHGAKWRFSSQEHLVLFQENPEKYAPQYGSY